MFFASPSVDAADWKTPMQLTSSWSPIYFVQGDNPTIYLQQTNRLPETPFTPPGNVDDQATFYQCSLNDRQVTKFPLESQVTTFAVCPVSSVRAYIDGNRSIQWFNGTKKRIIPIEKGTYPNQPYLSPDGNCLSILIYAPSDEHSRSLWIYQFDREKPIRVNLSKKMPRFTPYWFNENTLLGWSRGSVFLLKINIDFSRVEKQIVRKTPAEEIIMVLALEDRLVVGLAAEKAKSFRTLVLNTDGQILKELPNTWLCDDGLALDRYCCCIQKNTGLLVLDVKMLSTRLFIPHNELASQTDEDYNVLGYDPKNDSVYVSVEEPASAVIAYRPDKAKQVILKATPDRPYFTNSN
jgi:hypothetical protein